MKRTCALVVVAAMICSNCAARGPALRVDDARPRHTSLPVGVPNLKLTGNGTTWQDPDVWRRYAARLPIGSTVSIRTTGGERMTAVLMIVDDAGLTVKPRTRIPEPARRIPFERLAQLELARDSSNIGKAAAIGGAVGAGAFLGLLMLLFATVD